MRLRLVNSEVVVSDKGEHMELWTLQAVVGKGEAEVLRKKMGGEYDLEAKP